MALWTDNMGKASPIAAFEAQTRAGIEKACEFLSVTPGLPTFFSSMVAVVPQDQNARTMIAYFATDIASVPASDRPSIQAAVVRNSIAIHIRGNGELGAATLLDHLRREGFAPPLPPPIQPLSVEGMAAHTATEAEFRALRAAAGVI